MSMNRHHRVGLQSVEHPLALVFRGVAQVEVHPQARGGFGLSRQRVEEGGVDEHGLFNSSKDLYLALVRLTPNAPHAMKTSARYLRTVND